MKCDVRFTCLHTNCWKLVLLHFLLRRSTIVSSIQSFTRSFVRIRTHICVPDVCGGAWTHTRTVFALFMDSRFYWSKILALMSKDTNAHPHTHRRQHLHSHGMKTTNMLTKTQTFRKIWIDHIRTHSQRQGEKGSDVRLHSDVENLYKFMHYHV